MRLLRHSKGGKKWIIIDEVQKAPKLLDIVHQQIFEKNFLFALTGSSARKLKRGGANLLAGRAFVFNLFPLTAVEIGSSFSLHEALSFGTLPGVMQLNENEKKLFLKSYSQTFIKEEILAEQIVRNLPPFKRFLDIAASTSTEVVNYTNIAKDIHSDPKSVSNYFTILEDTYLGFLLPSHHASIRKQQKKAPKFYFFDTGVMRALSGMLDASLTPKTFEYGIYFENFMVNEIQRLLTYQQKDFKLSFLRIDETHEIDLIVEKPGKKTILCEIKSTDRVDERHVKTLELLGDSFNNPLKIVCSLDSQEKIIKGTKALFWKDALEFILEH